MAPPIKIDPADGPCPHCLAWHEAKVCVDGDRRARACDDCGRPIPVYRDMGGAGYEAATIHHYHLGDLGGKTLWLPIQRELCRACYLIDYAKQFPNAAPPILV